jgi:Na+/H+-dicarboxylate symporter
MGRSATNAVGNAIATAVVANWEDALETSPQQVAPVAAHAG